MRRLTLSLALLSAAAMPAYAQNTASAAPKSAAASSAAVASAATPLAAPPTRTASATYRASWNGFTVLNMAFAASVAPTAYSATANLSPAGMTGLTSHLKKSVTYSAQAKGQIKDNNLLVPGQYSHQGGKKKRKVSVDFSQPEVTASALPDFGTYGDPPASKAQKREATDSLTGILSLVVAHPENVCNKTLKIFDGKARYDMVFTPLGKERLKVKGFKGEALKCRVDYKRVAGYTKPEPGEKPLIDKPITFWFTANQNGLQVPAKFSVESNWGPISMTLESLTFGTGS